MNEEQLVCYITYAVPASMLPQLSLVPQKMPEVAQISQPEIVQMPQPEIYPAGFMPDWFFRGSFPEDDFED